MVPGEGERGRHLVRGLLFNKSGGIYNTVTLVCLVGVFGYIVGIW